MGKYIKMYHKENLQLPSYKILHTWTSFFFKILKKKTYNHDFAWFHSASKKKALGIIKAILARPDSEVAAATEYSKLEKSCFENDKRETCI